MPKVNEEHYEKVRQHILEAAKRVSLSKPIYNVAMRDIVVEAGMSQGGVYKYFANIDEVFIALLNQNALDDEVRQEVDSLFDQSKEPVEIVNDFLQYIGSYIQKAVHGSGKIYFELISLYANEPERFLKVKDQLLQVSVLEYLQRKLITFVTLQVEAQYFQPVFPLEEVFAFMTTAINGITNDALLADRLSQNQSGESSPDISRLIKTLSFAVSRMLGR